MCVCVCVAIPFFEEERCCGDDEVQICVCETAVYNMVTSNNDDDVMMMMKHFHTHHFLLLRWRYSSFVVVEAALLF